MKTFLVGSLIALLSQSVYANSYECTGRAEVRRTVSNDGSGDVTSEKSLFMTDLIVQVDGVSRVYLVKDHDSYDLSTAKNGAITIEADFGSNFYIGVGFTEDKDSIVKLPWGTHMVRKGDPMLNFSSKKLPEDFNLHFTKGDIRKEGETYYQIDCVLITQK